MKFKKEFTPLERIVLLQKWIILHSILYYDMDRNIVSDHTFDNNGKQLVELMKAHPDELEKSKYNYIMYDFDGCTGMNIPYRISIEDKRAIQAIIRTLI